MLEADTAEVVDDRPAAAAAAAGVTTTLAVGASTAAHLRRVDAVLDTALDEIDRQWESMLHDDRTDGRTDDRTDEDPADGVPVLGRSDLPALLRRTVNGGGKRLRPIMCFLGWQAVSPAAPAHDRDREQQAVARIGAALELLHVFALIHDDVMDQSTSRRGRPTVHALAAELHRTLGAAGDDGRFGESIAILLGDLAHAEADHLVMSLPAAVQRLWRQVVIELVCGQRGDLTGTAGRVRALADARRVARMKSGGYTVQRPLELGAAMAPVEPDAAGALGVYGREVGIAFALRDDILGVWGDPAVTGKPAGDDLRSGKPTAIVALAARHLGPEQLPSLDRLGSSELTGDDVARIQGALDDAGIRDRVERMIDRHVSLGLAALDDDRLDPHATESLRRLAYQIAWRDR